MNIQDRILDKDTLGVLLDLQHYVSASYESKGEIIVSLAKMGMLECMRYAAALGYPLSYKDASLDTALHHAARVGEASCMEILVENGIEVNARNSREATALHISMPHKNPECSEMLLKLGADIHAVDYLSNSVLHWCDEDTSVDLMKSILDRRIDINHRGYENKTPLNHAVDRGLPDMYHLLRIYGADTSLAFTC